MFSAACTPSGPEQLTGTAKQLVGAWAYDDLKPLGARSPPQGGCGTDFGVFFSADGTYSGYQEDGTWRAEGPYLVQVTTEEIGDKGDYVPVKSPKRTTTRLEWRSANIVNVRGDMPGDGYALVRCTDPTR